ncbi:MAG: Phosphoribosylformylglycinamidine synthase subunit PurQ [Alphaproteobacteria bacterium MarineAlpha9_Bin4]|nr:phosphoribosylformylglycinamidine synthase I [Pelagibacterales bacterium]PPR27003.1 MAG: Phosphoribosylformylglycinamidine synthase subunit PurQ [Alphaproteobacteria bacterium MarineAlpha9_Bin4]
MTPAIIVFPGSNCDKDILNSIKDISGKYPKLIWYQESIPKNTDFIIIPGGFSFGDYLRCGAIASKSNILKQINLFIKKGTPVLGICNGFQILTEAGFLPGMLLMNKNLKFICKCVNLIVTNTKSKFTNMLNEKEILSLPIAHKVGNYYINESGLRELILNNQVALRYSDEKGTCKDTQNPNGSIYNIAGVTNKKGNVMGMMPHPERYYDNKNKDTVMKKIIVAISNEK